MSKPASRLGRIRRTRLPEPPRILIYSYEGIGKTLLASDAPDVVMFDIELGSGELEVERYEFTDKAPFFRPRSLGDIYAAIEDLRVNDHPYKTLAIDTSDALEPIIWRHICERDSKRKTMANKGANKLIGVEDYGYGKGYHVAVDEWRVLLAKLENLRSERQMSILFLSHAHAKVFKNPMGEDYDRIQPRMHHSAAGLLKEWCEIVAYYALETATTNKNDDRIAKGYDTGTRILYTERCAAYDAKHRIHLPSEIEVPIDHPWAPLGKAISDSRELDTTEVMKLIGAELKRIGAPTFAGKVRKAVKESATDLAALSRYLNKLKKTQPKEEATK